MPDNLASCLTNFETTAPRHEGICLRPALRMYMEENHARDLEVTKQRSDGNLGKSDIQRRFSAPARCTRVTDLDVAAEIIARNSFCAPKDSGKLVTNAGFVQGSEILKDQAGRTDYVDMHGTRNLGLQGLLKLKEETKARRASSSAAMIKCQYPEYHNYIYMKPDDHLDAEQSILPDIDWTKPDVLGTRRIPSAPADCTNLVDSPLESRASSCSDNDLSYVDMGNYADAGDVHMESIVTLRSKCPDLIALNRCSPETRVDSGSSLYGSVVAYDTETKSPSSDASSGTADELYYSCRSHFSQTEDGQRNYKQNNVDVKTKLQEMVAQIPFKKFFNSIASSKSSVSMPNIHNASHRRVQKELSLPSNSPKTIKLEPHTRINMSWANDSFNEALDNPIKIPSQITLTIPGKPSFKSGSTAVKNIENEKEILTTSFNSCPANFSGNLTPIQIVMPSTSASKSKFTSVTINSADEVLASKKYQNSYEERYFSNNESRINEEMQEPSKNIDHKPSLKTIENSVSIGDLPKKICATKSKSGIFSINDLIFEQRYEQAITRSASVLRMDSSSETLTSDDPARRFLRFSSSSNASNSTRNGNGSNSSSNTCSSLLHPMFNHAPQWTGNGQTLPPASNASCSPLLPSSHDTSMATSTSLWIPENQSHSHQNYSNLFEKTALERTSSTPLLECPASPLISPAFVNTLSGHERSRDKSNHLHESDDSSSDVVPDRPQLLQYLFRSKSLAFHSHPLLPLLHRLIWLEFTLLHAPLEIKLLLSPQPPSLSALLTHYCDKQPHARASVAAVLPRGLVSSGQREGMTTTCHPEETPLPTLHRVMLEVVASTHYSVVDMMAELGTSDAPAQKGADSVSKSSSIHHSVQNVPVSNRRSFAIPYPAKYGSESVSICLNKSAARSSFEVEVRRPSPSVFYHKLPSFV